MDPTTAAVTFGSGALIAGVLQLLKPLIERVVPPTDPVHDPLIRFLAAFLGAAAFVVHAASLAPLTAPIFWDVAGQGVNAGLLSIATYHILAASMTPAAQTARLKVGQVQDVPPQA